MSGRKSARRNGAATVLRAWLPLAVTVTALCGLIYVGVQQSYRMSANDPQIQMAEDAAARLDEGASAASVVGSVRVDAAVSLAPWLVVCDGGKRAVAWSGVLDGKPARVPAGSLDAASASGRNTVTWQPRPGVRVATAIVPWKGGWVVAGRSLREVERRVDDLTRIVGLGLLATLGATLAAVTGAQWLEARKG